MGIMGYQGKHADKYSVIARKFERVITRQCSFNRDR